jgi:hypothetical protein
MRLLALSVVFCASLSGCSWFGYSRRAKAEWAPAAEAATVRFPDSFERGVQLTGPMVAALEVAMNEFLPPGSEVQTNDPDKSIARCLSRRETYETFVLRERDDLFFVLFIPVLERCGIDAEILDGGGIYAIDGKGRILAAQ